MLENERNNGKSPLQEVYVKESIGRPTTQEKLEEIFTKDKTKGKES